MKIINGTNGIGKPLTENQINDFLCSGKMNLFLGTIEDKNYPNIHPVWYIYENKKFYIVTEKNSKKIKNIEQNKSVYFAIASEEIPFKGVRGKGEPKIIGDAEFNGKIVQKIISKYLGDFENQLAKEIVEEIKNGTEIVIEISPKYLSTTNFESYFP